MLRLIIKFGKEDVHAIAVGCHGADHCVADAILAISEPELRMGREVELILMPERIFGYRKVCQGRDDFMK